MIDIIIPIYNARKTLEKTLMSISLQSIKDKLNVYLIDDASDENYDDIVNNFPKLNIILIRITKNGGAGVARQKGIDISSSKYIVFIDSDDLLYSTDALESLYNKIEEGFDVVSGVTFDEKKQSNVWNEGDLHAKIYRRSFLEENNVRFNKTRYHEDNYFNNLCLIAGARYELFDYIVYYYVNNDGSLTNDHSNKEFERLEILLSNMGELKNEALKRDTDRYTIAKLTGSKLVYFNRIWPTFTKEQQEQFINWTNKYKLNIEKYLGAEDIYGTENEVVREYIYWID